MGESHQVTVLDAILSERVRQDEIWGDQSKHNDSEWNVIATQQQGEVAKTIKESMNAKLFIELIQTGAIYFAWAESLLRRIEE